jgi:hypothetical protein
MAQIGLLLRDKVEASTLADLTATLNALLEEERRAAPDGRLLDSSR